jgi:hypothetical protein
MCIPKLLFKITDFPAVCFSFLCFVENGQNFDFGSHSDSELIIKVHVDRGLFRRTSSLNIKAANHHLNRPVFSGILV